MSPRPDIAWSRQLAGTSASAVVLWIFAGTVVMAAHGAAGWWLMQERPAPASMPEPAAIMIDLAAVPMAPAAVEEQIAPDEVDAEAAEDVPVETVEEVEVAEAVEPVEPEKVVEAEETPPEAVEPVETAEAVEPEPVEPVEEQVAALDPVELPLPQARPEPPRKEEARREKPKEKPRRKPEPAKAKQKPSAETRKAQVQAPAEAPRAAAPQNSSGASASVSPARWQARVASHLERRKRYPAAARRQGQQGTAQVRFTIDGSGNVQSVSLLRSSGVPALDEEVVALVRRASPVPAPPPGVNRTIVVPIRFSMR
ncbi:MAG: energy transducer TonB [Hyphomicrobiales bacterium]|nr:MAG: energy transducer TonB [Hyphomicrobiales bacterium]